MDTPTEQESDSPNLSAGFSRLVILSILVAALGYFVDIYDLLLFSIVRVKSLQSLGLSGDALLSKGVLLLNMQMLGMLLGGIFWGIIGDKKGRLSVLFGSIFIYSIANILNGLVQNVEQYALLRFIAGVGLAGELGAGITLVSELMPRHSRGYGTTIVASVGILGAVVAAFVANLFDWRTSYYIGGGLGLCLLLLRVGLFESGMFSKVKENKISRGNFLMLFNNLPRALKYLNCILIGLPIWYVVGILITFSPEFGKAFGMAELPTAGNAVKYCYIGLSLGDLGSGLLSQRLRSRKKVVWLFLGLTALAVGAYFILAPQSLGIFYLVCGFLGFSVGFWAIFVTMASENFGTNIRATVTTTAPNFIRGSVVPLTLAFEASKGSLGLSGSALMIGAVTLLISAIALSRLEETYGRDLDFLEN
ncbi:MFS transporter [bacterium (Candidatus Blackallbacteria) CG17_big_fil_post_rev_8_21_14_2_50_48_46]|uniref:MFS transporter n=1 Tax=bacterium (Candidatus Blackallbacteria) CG17_big_fil_post_rev_8_21_14_2_50_48_46 TaxID=2014261 RepID=A0A2M7GA40_9BACT|nr:MAG: MFS transporter [bacterium (Candidatus Blackallbacteria) CG18_big_fil_WC_8_21_14_2_50_49_26]PIW19011.1 MAG: MFS transporter [bacterium (Candidatus Blackallbacteria) CG17_big_fil_post_rev_8_21_14_2_50_48_46]PIW44621.1 MAG: MFS transporter [bacterium (Candidatus Blackallbacteria) CG13_big_fil_rev_8_21_14_2_50_49_14]